MKDKSGYKLNIGDRVFLSGKVVSTISVPETGKEVLCIEVTASRHSIFPIIIESESVYTDNYNCMGIMYYGEEDAE